MKKNYNQPIVETTDLIAGGQALCSSPAAGIGAGSTGGGTTGDIGGGSTPIPGE
jgi:hypothetical protein